MFKTVPFAKEYEMSLEGQIRRKDGQECNLTTLIINGKEKPAITLKIYTMEKTVALEWLKCITHFEVSLPRVYFWNIFFVPSKTWKYSNNLNIAMRFKTSMPEFKNGYRYVPEYLRYAISNDGVLIDTYTSNILPHSKYDNGYIQVSVYSPDKNKITSVVLHRLVALAWVPNPAPLELYMVNHIDGNKKNPYYKNLEWVSHTGNITHAFANDLRGDNTGCKIREVATDKITIFVSLRQACDYMGVAPKSYPEFVRHNSSRLINGKYQIKLVDDITPWPSLIKKDKLVWDEAHAIQVYVIKSGEVLTFPTVGEASNYLNVHKSTIMNNLSRNEKVNTNGYAYRFVSDKPWDTNFYEAENRPIGITAKHSDGRVLDCSSAREAELKTGVNRKAIVSNLHGKKINFEWQFVNKYKD